MLSHLISLDTRHQASLKQPLSPCQIHGPVQDPTPCMRRVHLVHTDTQIENKGNPETNISATWCRDRQAAAENGTNRDEDKPWKEEGEGAIERLNMSLMNRGGRFSCLRAIPVNIDVDVRSTLLRISYKAKGLDLLCANSKHHMLRLAF